ncbi:MAG: hypothetical protein V3574_00630 [Candidatus Moraniibacteriota bacterium]
MENLKSENLNNLQKEVTTETEGETLPPENSPEKNENQTPMLSSISKSTLDLMKTPEKGEIVDKCLECEEFYGENANAVKNNKLSNFTISHGFCSEECVKKHLKKAFGK